MYFTTLLATKTSAEIDRTKTGPGVRHRTGDVWSRTCVINSVMYPFKKILFPLDYSAPCEAIVPYVKEMMERFSADLTLVHAYSPDALAYSILPPLAPNLADEARTFEERRLREFAQETFTGKRVECFAESGEAGSVIDRIVRHEGTDVVMLPTHGHGRIRRFLLGSVAAKVLHDVSAAVWTGTGSALMEHKPSVPYQGILCAVDGGEEAETVLKAAAAFSCTYRADLWIVHVVDIPAPTPELDYTPYRKDLLDAAEMRLRDLKDKLGIHAPHAVFDGMISEGVRQEAVRRKADLIITGRGHSQDRFERMWSHLYQIVRESPCPVLSI